MTQQEAAELLGYKKAQFLSHLERGTRKAPVEVLKKMCEVYRVPEHEMREQYIQQAITDAEENAQQKWDGYGKNADDSDESDNYSEADS